MGSARLAALAAVLAACGGHTDDVAWPTAPPDERDASTTSPPDADAGFSEAPDDAALPPVDAATITVRPPAVTIRPLDGGVCVNVDPSAYDRSCDTAADCRSIASGMVCSGNCLCANSAISVYDWGRYQQAIEPLVGSAGVCHCPMESVPSCVDGGCGGP
jgi:hypothetical protein